MKKIIKKYPKLFPAKKGSANYINYCGVPKEWFPIIERLCHSIQNYIDTCGKEQTKIVQIKSKFGTLRVYVSSIDTNIMGMIEFAELACNKIKI